MPQSLEQQFLKFAVGSQFKSFAALKYTCIHTALLDVYEFIPDKVDSGCYNLNCINKECIWYLYAGLEIGQAIPNVWPIIALGFPFPRRIGLRLAPPRPGISA